MGERVQWLVGAGGSTVFAALETVSQECSEQCTCSAADFGVQEDLSTTARLVTSPEPTHQDSTTPQSTSEAADETTVQGTPSTSSSGAVSTTAQSTTLTPGASCRFSVVFCNGYSGGSIGEDATTPPPPENWSSWLVSAILMGEVVLTEWTSHPVRTHLRQKSAVLSVRILSMWSTIQKRIARVQRTIPASLSTLMGVVQYAATSTLTYTTMDGVVTSTPEFATTLFVQAF